MPTETKILRPSRPKCMGDFVEVTHGEVGYSSTFQLGRSENYALKVLIDIETDTPEELLTQLQFLCLKLKNTFLHDKSSHS